MKIEQKKLIENNFPKQKLHVVYNSINLKQQTEVYEKLKIKIKLEKKSPYKHFFGKTKIKK